MTIKIRPSRRGNFDKTGARLRELGITCAGYDHHENCYADPVIPPGIEAQLADEPLIEVVTESVPAGRRRAGPAWDSHGEAIDVPAVGHRLHKLRLDLGLDLQTVVARASVKLTAAAIEKIEQTGQCKVRDLIALADVYGASLDRIAGRHVVRGSRRH
jgi:hypothetical protein